MKARAESRPYGSNSMEAWRSEGGMEREGVEGGVGGFILLRR